MLILHRAARGRLAAVVIAAIAVASMARLVVIVGRSRRKCRRVATNGERHHQRKTSRHQKLGSLREQKHTQTFILLRAGTRVSAIRETNPPPECDRYLVIHTALLTFWQVNSSHLK